MFITCIGGYSILEARTWDMAKNFRWIRLLFEDPNDEYFAQRICHITNISHNEHIFLEKKQFRLTIKVSHNDQRKQEAFIGYKMSVCVKQRNSGGVVSPNERFA